MSRRPGARRLGAGTVVVGNGGEIVADVLARRGVRFLFTVCGGHISPILVGCKRRGLRVIDVRHEATAVFAADGTARLTGVPGVAAATAGPGLTNAVTAVKNAELAQSPVVVLGGATATLLKGRGALQDIDQMALMRPHVKRAFRPRRVRELGPAVEAALRAAQDGVPGPVFVECPVDLLYDEGLVRSWYASAAGSGRGLRARARRAYLAHHLGRLFASGRTLPAEREPPVPPEPPPDAASRAAALLARARRPVLVVGSQALLAAAEAEALADAVGRLAVPAYLSGMARGLLGREHPLQLRHRRKQALREADLVLLAGVPCDFRLDYGRHVGRGATLIAVNRSAADLRRNRRPSLGVQAAPERFLQELARTVPRPEPAWAEWRAVLRARDDEREAEIEAQAAAESPALGPLTLSRAIERAVGPGDILVGDGGDFVATASYVVRPRAPLSWLDPGVFGTLGVGAGFALAAKLTRPEAEVWLLWGDGAAGYGLVELDTFVRHGLGLIAVVGNDAGWQQIAREQVETLGDDVGTVLRATDYERAAEGLGACGLRVESPAEADAALRAARAAAAQGTPVLLNALLAKSAFRKGSIAM